ncbi:leucine-rich repeat-containing protein 74a [Biomphalaria glabrata]|nr:leucine-rich repeat-containing protein 74B-like [Biomphalaria glabrata]
MRHTREIQPSSKSMKTEQVSNSLQKRVAHYKNICKKLGVLPVRKVFSQFGSVDLSFKNITLTPKDVMALCLALKEEEQAASLDLTGICVNQNSIDQILHLLDWLSGIYQVGLGFNNLSGSAVITLSRYLTEDNCISRLDLTGNRLNDRDAITVGELLKVSVRRKFKCYSLSQCVPNCAKCSVKKNNWKTLPQAKNKTLEVLDLSWNHIRRYGAIGVARGLQRNTSICTVNLSWNGFGFEGSVAVGDMLSENTTITELDLGCNRIGPPALLEVLRGVARNRTLHILKIGFNPITAGFTSIILSVIRKNNHIGLQNVDLQGVVVDKEFVVLLQEIQKDRFFIVQYELSLPVKKLTTEEMREMVGLPCAYNVDPLKLLYLLKEKMRAADFFYKINKDKDDGLQKNELYNLFEEAGLPVTSSVLDKIMEFMDTNEDGIIDLKEFLLGDKRIKNISRKQVRVEQERRAKDIDYNKYSRTFQKAHIDPITSTLKIDPSTSPMRQSRRKSSTDKTVSDTLNEEFNLNLP